MGACNSAGFREHRALVDFLESTAPTLEVIASKIAESLDSSGKLLLCGNGGSAADSQHIAAEFVGRFQADRPAMAAVALTTDSSALTAIGNDYSFEQIFSRQVDAIGRRGDVLICLSTSGKSPNVVAAAVAAKQRGLLVIGFLGGTGGTLAAACDLAITVPSNSTARVQEIHIFAAHLVCEAVEDRVRRGWEEASSR